MVLRPIQRRIWPGRSQGVIDLDFARGRFFSNYRRVSGINAVSGWTYSRTGTEYAQTSSGLLVPFGSGVPAVTDLGLQVWEARTEVVLWNRDLTNAAWVKSSITAALDQTGVDGAANSASSVTATGANGTVLQSITLASSARASGAWVKRLVGSGAVSMTMDNGATYTAVTVTAGWTFVSIPTQTLANPVVGFKLATSGDKIAVDFAQNQNGAFCGPSILTTSASATRGAASASVGGLSLPGAFAVKFNVPTLQPTGFPRVLDINDGTTNNRISILYSGGNQLGIDIYAGGVQKSSTNLPVIAANTDYVIAGRLAAGDVAVSVSGGVITTAAPASLPTVTTLNIGANNGGTGQLDGSVKRLALYPASLTNAQLQALGTSF